MSLDLCLEILSNYLKRHLAPWIQQTITNLPSGLFIGHFFSRYKQLIGKSSGLVVSVLFVGSDEEDMNDEYG